MKHNLIQLSDNLDEKFEQIKSHLMGWKNNNLTTQTADDRLPSDEEIMKLAKSDKILYLIPGPHYIFNGRQDTCKTMHINDIDHFITVVENEFKNKLAYCFYYMKWMTDHNGQDYLWIRCDRFPFFGQYLSVERDQKIKDILNA